MELRCCTRSGVQLKAGSYVNISPKDGTAATQLPTAPGVQQTTALNFSPMLLHSGVCGGKGSIRYGVCLPHFIPPLAPSLGLPGFGLQASGFPISITNLPNNSGQC